MSGSSQESSQVLRIIKYYFLLIIEITLISSYTQVHYMKGNVQYINLNDIFHRCCGNRTIIKSVITVIIFSI